MLQPLSCGFLIVRGQPIDSFLLMKHPHRWDLPKGHVDEGETELQCALRELEEETGIAAADIEIDPVFRFAHSYPVNQKRYGGRGLIEKKLLIYLGRVIRPVDIILTEHNGYEWFPWNPPHNIQEMTINPLLRQLSLHLQSQNT